MREPSRADALTFVRFCAVSKAVGLSSDEFSDLVLSRVPLEPHVQRLLGELTLVPDSGRLAEELGLPEGWEELPFRKVYRYLDAVALEDPDAAHFVWEQTELERAAYLPHARQ